MTTDRIRTPFRLYSLLAGILALSGCSMSQLVVRTSMPLMEDSMQAMYRETDLQLARSAMPANLKMLEGMIEGDPGNARLRVFAAEGYYGYSFAFVERDSAGRAGRLYDRCFNYAATALRHQGIEAELKRTPLEELEPRIDAAAQRHVPALFWAASCWAKWIDMNRDDPRSVAQLAKAALLMERVLELDPDFYHGGPHTFFGVYYGSRPPMLGGDLARAASHFDKAEGLSEGRMLMIEVLRAEFLHRQQLDREAFHRSLMEVVKTPADRYPELAFVNQVARQRAQWLLGKEEEWF